jgi:type II secretory pathway pseudopilin PulG
VELLVVIAIIGILIALLLPAVQAAREAARRSQCSNNLKQIILAVHNYHDVNKALPPGSTMHHAGWPQKLHRGNVFVRLLPFMEQKPLYDTISPYFRSLYGDGMTTSVSDVHFGIDTIELNGKNLGATRIPALQCPSDSYSNNLVKLADGWPDVYAPNYAASSGGTDYNGALGSGCGYDSYIAPNTGNSNPAGPFWREGYWTSLNFASISDGLSNTIFFGEVRPKCTWEARVGWHHTEGVNGFCTTVIPLNYPSCTEGGSGCSSPQSLGAAYGFKSEHPGGAQFALGDGSVRFFGQTIDHWTYQYLGNRDDGHPVQVP